MFKMASIRWSKTCEICKKRYSRSNDEKRKFMTRFPLDEDRCKQWVKRIGNEDLAYIPIEKLHQIKYVCGDHFHPKDFNKKKSRLNKWAVPSLFIKAQPLPDHLLAEFPCHIAKSEEEPNVQSVSSEIENRPADHNYTLKRHYDHNYDAAMLRPLEISQQPENLSEEPSAAHFSWQKSSTTIPCDTEVKMKELWMESDEANEMCMYDERDSSSPEVETGKKTKFLIDNSEGIPQGYQCNSCGGDISGFRYTCVQCPDYDLCAACEAGRAHAGHYALRVPGPRPYSEIQAVLATIRKVLMTDSIVQLESYTGDDFNVVVKKEEPDPIGVEEVLPLPTALGGQEFNKKARSMASLPVEERNERDQEAKTEEGGETLEEVVETLDEDLETYEDVEMLEEYIDTDSAWSEHSYTSDSHEYPVLNFKMRDRQNTSVGPNTPQALETSLEVRKVGQNTNVRLPIDDATTETRLLNSLDLSAKLQTCRKNTIGMRLSHIDAKTNPVTVEKVQSAVGRQPNRQNINLNVKLPSASTIVPPIDTQLIGESERPSAPHSQGSDRTELKSSKTREYLLTRRKNVRITPSTSLDVRKSQRRSKHIS